MKPETKCAGLSWGLLEPVPSSLGAPPPLTNLILASHSVVRDGSGSLGEGLQTFHAIMEKD